MMYTMNREVEGFEKNGNNLETNKLMVLLSSGLGGEPVRRQDGVVINQAWNKKKLKQITGSKNLPIKVFLINGLAYFWISHKHVNFQLKFSISNMRGHCCSK